MSIKSQKSLNEECSEIWDRSYSVRSASEHSFTCDEDDDDDDVSEQLCRELLRAMTPAVLSRLRRTFHRRRGGNLHHLTRRVEETMVAAAAAEGVQFPARGHAAGTRSEHDQLWTDEQTFVTAINDIFGDHSWSVHAHALFLALDPLGAREVCWSELVERLVRAGGRNTSSRADTWRQLDQGIVRLKHCKRETIMKLVNIETDSSFCSAAVSRGGRVGLYTQSQLLHQYQLWYHRSGISKRVKNAWVTDAIYLSDVECLLISASDRSLSIYDASVLTHTLVYCITGLPHIPTCVAYDASQRGGGGGEESSELVVGDEAGHVTRVRFHRPRVALFHRRYADRLNSYYWTELSSPPHDAHCTITCWRRVHARSVRRVQVCRRRDVILSCSHDSSASLVMRHRPGKIRDYVFNVARGITCFHMVPSLHLLATGSADGVVRLWESTQPTPYAKLQASGRSQVLDVAVIKEMAIVMACCRNCWVDIWDLYEECLLQTVKIKYPFLGLLGKKADFGSYCIHPGPPRKKPSVENVPTLSPSPDPDVTASRRSSVHRGDTGGLMLQGVHDHFTDTRDKSEGEFLGSEVLFTCCDYVCTVRVVGGGGGGSGREELGEVPPPPRDTRPARAPSGWDLHATHTRALGPLVADAPPRHDVSPSTAISTPRTEPDFLSPESARVVPRGSSLDLDELLESAGLQDILEKDFVLMMGLKHDLNQKLSELAENMEQMCVEVSAGAPHRALRLHTPAHPATPPHPATPRHAPAPAPAPAGDQLTRRYQQLLSLFPSASTIASSPRTPRSDSNKSPRTPRSDSNRSPRTPRSDSNRSPRTPRSDSNKSPRTPRSVSSKSPRSDFTRSPSRKSTSSKSS